MSEADKPIDGLRIVLVETSHPGNIGAAARAMKNMGVTELVLVNPRAYADGKLDDKALFRAASAQDVVQAAQVVTSLDEAIADCELVIGTSARSRRIPWPLLNPRECGEKVVAELAQGSKVAILFGREDHGPSNDELQRCQFHVNIPTGDAYPSLNLAMAVQVITYEILMARLDGRTEPLEWDMPPATAVAVERLYEHFEQTMVQVGFHDPDNPKQVITRLRRLFQRIRPDRMEVSMLRGFLSAVNDLASGRRKGPRQEPQAKPSKEP